MLAVLGGPNFPAVGDLGIIQILSDLGTNLSGIAVDGLLAEHQHIELDAFHLLDLLDALGEDVTGSQGVGAAAGAVGDQESLVAAHGQALAQSLDGLSRTHGQDIDLGVLVLILDAGSGFQCVSIERADDGGNTFTHQGVGHGIDFDDGRVRHLFNANKYVHF